MTEDAAEYYKILRTIRRYSKEHSRPPGLRELARAAGVPKTTLRRRLQSLEQRGCVRITTDSGRLVVERVEIPTSLHHMATTPPTLRPIPQPVGSPLETIAEYLIVGGIIGTIVVLALAILHPW